MKKIIISLCLVSFFAGTILSQSGIPGHPKNSDLSQMDTGFFRNVLIKVNPFLIISGIGIDGEYGGIIQFPIIRTWGQNGIFKNMDAYIGGGYNQSFDGYTAITQPNGKGYTIRTGVYCFMKKRKYLSLQFFYRKWNIKGIYDADYTPDGSDDNILDPSVLIFPDVNSPVQYLENAAVNVYSADVVYGKQHRYMGKSQRLYFEWYVGAGIRLKTGKLEELGYYDPNTQGGGPGTGVYYPLSVPRYSNISEVIPDIKLGFMVGFIL